MKKLLFTAALAVTLLSQRSALAEFVDEDAIRWSPLALGIASPLQYPPSEANVYGLRLGSFYGASRDVYGLDATLVSYETGALAGLQLAGFTWTEKSLYGLQVGVIANVVFDQSFGCQIGLVNLDYGDATGLLVGAVNKCSTFGGIQLAALANWNSLTSAGLSLALVNIGKARVEGLVVGGWNMDSEIAGLQVGVLNQAYAVTGVQVGVVNACDNLHGVQIGFLNMVTTSPLPIMVIANMAF